MHVSSSTTSQAYAAFSARSSGSTATWRVHQQADPSGGTCGSSDSAQISSDGFAALLQSQDSSQAQDGDQQSPFTDDQANQIGALIQQQDAASFGKLDTDQDGKLSAAELTAALNAVQPQPQDGSGGPPALSDDQAQKIGERIAKHDPDKFAKLDTDGDGKLSAGEVDAGRKSGLLKPHHHGGPPPPPPPDAAADSAQSGSAGADSGSAGAGTSDYMANLIQDLLRNLGASTAA